jgi:hypothetical protein
MKTTNYLAPTIFYFYFLFLLVAAPTLAASPWLASIPRFTRYLGIAPLVRRPDELLPVP